MPDRGRMRVEQVKYIVVLADGMADLPIPQLDGKTPLEYANTPFMDALARAGEVGLVQTVPKSMKPGSDVANLAVLGYDPEKNYSGRSSLEALSVGAWMEEKDVAFRCNLVTLSEKEPYEQKRILDHSAGEISTEEAGVLMEAIRGSFQSERFRFYTGNSYRHLLLCKAGQVLELEPPHDHLGSVIGPYLPESQALRDMMKRSYDILNMHPINLKRAAQGKNKANSLWFWGVGTKPSLQNFQQKTGLSGAMISAVDLLKGIALGVGMQNVHVKGADGSLHTNYTGKAQAAVKALLEDDYDFAYIHVEAPDEMGHQGNVEGKVQAIESIDSRIISYIMKTMEMTNTRYRMLLLPDHATPVQNRTHTSDPVPYVLFDSAHPIQGQPHFSERDAERTGIFEPQGHRLIKRLVL